MKYKVNIPKPSAKRMNNSGKVIVTYHNGWDGDQLVQHEIDQDLYDINKDLSEFEFDIPDKYEWIHSTKIIDGWSFDVAIQYSNSTGSRIETYQLVPEKLC